MPKPFRHKGGNALKVERFFFANTLFGNVGTFPKWCMAQTRVGQRLVAAMIGVRVVMYEMAGGLV